jgi:hypothetical protein
VPAEGGELDGVGEEVKEDLAEAVRVGISTATSSLREDCC